MKYNFIEGLFFGFTICLALMPLICNLIYFSNIDLFLDLCMTKKRRKKLIEHIKKYY